MHKLIYSLALIFITSCIHAESIDDYLQIKQLLGKKLEFKTSGIHLKNVLKEGTTMLGREKPKYFKNNLGDNNFSYFLFTCRRLPMFDYELEAAPHTVMMVTNARGHFGQSTCMAKDIYDLKYKTDAKNKVIGTFSIEVLSTIKGKLCFTGKKIDKGFTIVKIGIIKKGSDKIKDSEIIYQKKN